MEFQNHAEGTENRASELSPKAIFLNALSLSESERRHSIKILLDKKRSGNNVVANSLTALKYLYGWPSINKIKCVSGLVSCRIQPNGDVLYCSRKKSSFKPIDCVDSNFQKAFNALIPVSCAECLDVFFLIWFNNMCYYKISMLYNIIMKDEFFYFING